MKALFLLSMLLAALALRSEEPLPPLVSTTHAVPYGHDYFGLRGGLQNCRIKFERGKIGRVAFLGGSITQGGTWRSFVADALQRRFPETKFDFINAGISSMGSTPHAFRYTRDALAHGPVDLLFVEAAVNDSTNGQTDVEMLRGMEGVVRHARMDNPAIDIVMLHFADPEKVQDYDAGKVPAVVAQHEKVAAHYKVPSIDLAREVAERIRAGEFKWKQDFKDLHPSPFGHSVYFRSIKRLFDAAWTDPLKADAQVQAWPLPAALDEQSYFRGRLIDLKDAQLVTGWSYDPNWKPREKIGTRAGFVNVPALTATEPGATLKLKFNGTAAGIFAASGPDTGAVEFRTDGGAWHTRDLHTQWSSQLHLPWAQVLAVDLPLGEHELELRVAPAASSKSNASTVRIMHFLAN